MKKPFFSLFLASLDHRHEVAILYFGRVSDLLMMTSERMVIPDDVCMLEQLLSRLRERGDRWAYELDSNHVTCTINRKSALLSDTIKVGDEIGVFSRKSWYEI